MAQLVFLDVRISLDCAIKIIFLGLYGRNPLSFSKYHNLQNEYTLAMAPPGPEDPESPKITHTIVIIQMA